MTRIRSTPAVLLALAVAVLGGCGDSSGPAVQPASAITRTLGNNQTGPAGEALQTPLTVRVTDAQGNTVSGANVTFVVEAGGGSLSAAQVASSADGTAQTTWTLGQQAGADQRVMASVTRQDGTLAATPFIATATAGTPTILAKVRGDNQRGGTGAALADSLVIRVTDRFGNGVPQISVTWSGVVNGRGSPAASATDDAGFARTAWILGESLGAAQLQATVGSLPPASFAADAVLSITGIEPAIIGSGTPVIINGVGFSPAVAANMVSIGGVTLTVTEATPTMIRATLPARTPCIPSGNALVTLRSAEFRTSRSHPVQLAPLRAFAAGEAIVGSADDLLDCVALPADGSRYMIAVTNTSPTVAPSATQGFTVRGTGATAPVTAPAPSIAEADVPFRYPGVQLTPAQARQMERFASRRLRHVHEHNAVLSENLRLLQSLRLSSEQLNARRLRAQQARAQTVPSLGDTLTMRVPRVGQNATTCAAVEYDEVRARVAYVGSRSIILEDVGNPVTNVLDHMYRQMGEEFDAQQYDIVRANFGDPLLLDEFLDDNGRLFMLFTRHVDGNRVSGFVFSGDFSCPQLNNAEIFYGYAPTNPSFDYGENTAGEWFWAIRSTIIHEVKHLASFAARLLNSAGTSANPWEDGWLEESTAMVAEEIWARQVYGYQPNSNVGYSASVGCEIRGALAIAPCVGKPAIMFLHFLQLRDWMSTPEQRSPLGGTGPNDGSFYGSGWLFVRWLAENSGKPENVFFTELTQSLDKGGTNIERRVGRPFADLLGEWALATVLDDRLGVTPANSRLRIASWNLRDVYRGLNQEQPGIMPVPFPFAPGMLGFGNSTTVVETVRGGGTKYFELSGTAQPQTLEFLGAGGGELSPSLRVSIFRIQ